MRTILPVALILLMLTGCTRPAQPPAAQPTTEQGAVAADPAKAPAPEPPSLPPAPAGRFEDALPVPAPLPAGMRRVDLAAGQPVESAGLYFMDVASGTVAGWESPLNKDGWPAYSLWPSGDERWIMATEQTDGYLIRRADGAAFRYDPQQVALTMGPGVFLTRPMRWSAGDGNRCALLDGQLKLFSTFSLKDGCNKEHEVLFSPDGKALAVSGPKGDDVVTLVTAATGTVKGLGPFADPPGLTLSGVRLSALPATGELVVALELTAPGGSPWQPVKTIVRRYTWAGELRSEQQIPGWLAAFAPDGKLLAYRQHMGSVGEAAVVQEWGADTPRFRVAGGLGPQWLANGKELLLTSSLGYQLVTTAGAMQDASQIAGGPSYRPFTPLSPSPDDADLFVTYTLGNGEAGVVDRTGRTRRAAPAVTAKPVQVVRAEWGPTAKGFHFNVSPLGGKGYEGELWNWIAPKVQRPPFPDKYPLVVADPKGDCLNLRVEPSVGGKLIRCLPGGTRLDAVQWDRTQMAWRWAQDFVWAQVETEQGEQGWVAVNLHAVVYAD